MLSKENIFQLKLNGGEAVADLVNSYRDIGSIVFILENLGRLPYNFNGNFLYGLLEHSHSQIRLNAVKNIGKLNGKSNIDKLINLYETEKDTSVRREIVSAIGRQRQKDNKKYLYEFLNDDDPKIVCQAIRGLLVFEKDNDVEEHLKPLINHQNEMIRTVIYKEYFSIKKNKNNSFPHTETYEFLKNTIVNADVLEALKYVPDESVHLTFTSPPYYNARDYSIYPSYKAYLEFLSDVFKEVYRITKEGRFFLLNTSPIIVPRISRAHASKRYPIPFDIHPYLIEMGWEFIDDIIWVKPEASVKNRVGGFQQHRKPLGYKPNPVTEYVMVYRKTTEKLLDWNIHQYDNETIFRSKVADGFETTNVWKIDPCFDKIHTAVFPVELCKKVIQYYSYKGDLVFDPFGGSGTVGKTAKSLDRLFFLTEKEANYFEYMKTQKNYNRLIKERETRFLSLDAFKENIK
ncbi:MAG: HEAT repeat domain-containing protein [Defluviitaleaceae bacterium]|nr:HEAT repeat domain-containing protein [Defluviitaleaceae bacterium]